MESAYFDFDDTSKENTAFEGMKQPPFKAQARLSVIDRL